MSELPLIRDSAIDIEQIRSIQDIIYGPWKLPTESQKDAIVRRNIKIGDKYYTCAVGVVLKDNQDVVVNYNHKKDTIFAGGMISHNLKLKTIQEIIPFELPSSIKSLRVAEISDDAIGNKVTASQNRKLIETFLGTSTNANDLLYFPIIKKKVCLQNAQNIIISGPPGIGKSYVVKNHIVPAIINCAPKNEDKTDNEHYIEQIERITFTPSTSYEDFLGCYKPKNRIVETPEYDSLNNVFKTVQKNEIMYSFVPGAFCRILTKALLNPNKQYALIVEELNRAEVYDVFGPVFQLLDRNENGVSEYHINTPEDIKSFFEMKIKEIEEIIEKDKSDESSDKKKTEEHPHYQILKESCTKLVIPKNLHIVCTMNNSDQGVHLLDTAFKRRFSFAYMDIDGNIYRSPLIPFTEDYGKFSGQIISGFGSITKPQYDELRNQINNIIQSAHVHEDRKIGKYFIQPIAESEDHSAALYSSADIIIKLFDYVLQDILKATDKLNDLFADNIEYNSTVNDLLRSYFENKVKNESQDFASVKHSLLNGDDWQYLSKLLSSDFKINT